MDTDKELSYREFVMRENSAFHAPLNSEFVYYNAVKNGEIETVTKLCKNEFASKVGFGKLSNNPLQNMKYHFVVTTALIARYCIEGGMEHETAYNLSDYYIQKVDKCTLVSQISKLHVQLSLDYTQRMNKLRKDHIISKHIVKCIDYIYNNLHTRIRVSDLTQYVGLNQSYLSKLFKKELGVSITDYIQQRKIETAKNMLQYSSYLPSQISTILSFPNQSYFINVFKKKVGMSPKHYQDICFRKTSILIDKERVPYQP